LYDFPIVVVYVPVYTSPSKSTHNTQMKENMD